jgi:ribosomal protein S18 acetylase RimI-like enzyme
LALRSKAHWGYDGAFIDACRNDLTFTDADVVEPFVSVLEDDGRMVGFYALRVTGDEATLTDLFVEPEYIGSGYGRHLWSHAVTVARDQGCALMVVHSDPYAEGFYQAMGAQRVGVVPSSVFPDRLLPLMHYALL